MTGAFCINAQGPSILFLKGYKPKLWKGTADSQFLDILQRDANNSFEPLKVGMFYQWMDAVHEGANSSSSEPTKHI